MLVEISDPAVGNPSSVSLGYARHVVDVRAMCIDVTSVAQHRGCDDVDIMCVLVRQVVHCKNIRLERAKTAINTLFI